MIVGQSQDAPTAADTLRLDLTISIATWNNRDLVALCMRSILEGLGDLKARIVVVDNASTDGTAEMIRAEFPQVELLCSDQPRGFSANHNRVLRRAAGRHVLLLNDDTVVIGDALVRAVAFLDGHPPAGAAGCTLVRPDATPERISQRFPHPLDPIFSGLRRKVRPDDAAVRGDAVEVDRLSGACLMVRREALDRVGLLDERFDPAYGEDTDLCWRIKQAGWRIYRLPHARVIHRRGATAKRELPDQAYRLQAAKFRWYRKHRSRPALWVYRSAVVIASAAHLLFSLPRLLAPGARPAATARIRRLCARLQASLLAGKPEE